MLEKIIEWAELDVSGVVERVPRRDGYQVGQAQAARLDLHLLGSVAFCSGYLWVEETLTTLTQFHIQVEY